MATESSNRSLGNAQRAKEDEFYTQLSDIERELKHYRKHFDGKVVYCNCDDPRVRVIPPLLAGCIRRIHAAIFSFCAGVMPPMPMFGRSLL